LKELQQKVLGKQMLPLPARAMVTFCFMASLESTPTDLPNQSHKAILNQHNVALLTVGEGNASEGE
jgi:hypothetical protein